MRLRVCIVLAALAGAAGSMILAVDSYRRLAVVEHFSTPNTAGALVFGMAHALGNAGAGALFLSIGLLALAEKKKSNAPEPSRDATDSQPAILAAPISKSAVEPSSAPEALTVAAEESLPAPVDEPVKASESTPVPDAPAPAEPVAEAVVKPPFRPAKNIYFVENPAHTDEEIALQTDAADIEFRRAAVYEKVVVKPDEIEPATPISDTETNVAGAALGDESGEGKSKPEAPKDSDAEAI